MSVCIGPQLAPVGCLVVSVHMCGLCRRVQALNKHLQLLGEVDEHGPLLLMWAAVCQLNADVTGDVTLATLARKFGHRSVQLRAFHYLSSQLSNEPFTGKTVCIGLKICATVYIMINIAADLWLSDSLLSK